MSLSAQMSSLSDPLVKEADVVVGPLFVHSWQDHPVRRMPSQGRASPGKGEGLHGRTWLWPSPPPYFSFLDAGHLWMLVELAAVAGLVILIFAVLGALTVCWERSNPV